MRDSPHKENLSNLTFDQLVEFVRGLSEPASGASDLWKWIYRRFETDFGLMNGIRPSLIEKLERFAEITTIEPLEERVSADSLTRKVLFRLADGKTIETALMFFKNQGSGRDRRTICVSSQVGCPVGCAFCATGQQGFERNLSPGEIVAQVLYFLRLMERETAPDEANPQRRLTNVVFMGMGEPLANYDNVRRSITILNSPKGLNMGIRQITLSTSGMAPEILKLAQDDVQCQLALSLHAANDELRRRLVPLARKYPVGELMPVCREYSGKTGRHVYIEYALFDQVNDSPKDADELIELLGKGGFPVNLIPCNETSANGFHPPSLDTARAFQKRLISGGVRAMLRVSRGADIGAGCGQLKSRWLESR
ncbi:23S rRNA (adenine(2503)-C(2))-methyltransferase [Dehalogenimonas formicexedens]|uniref:Probable dual-specificity RNA methyltransferase RlmN n=1 Tax=Dehalogenimonas formicexedens TaxID=1839801 RepID=A0A1P8F8K5_9CHLR|nr:23S rRNA (adenine(2503)-C(2))-methyltransferase RlmN [Dehalogenimonas formicexedens]APV44806.1 23S rRNA (adenine(2503)-C(2))-methyltransferase [Dehalogenimonas formicexedens]